MSGCSPLGRVFRLELCLRILRRWTVMSQEAESLRTEVVLPPLLELATGAVMGSDIEESIGVVVSRGRVPG